MAMSIDDVYVSILVDPSQDVVDLEEGTNPRSPQPALDPGAGPAQTELDVRPTLIHAIFFLSILNPFLHARSRSSLIRS
jgi:hypothetical protein